MSIVCLGIARFFSLLPNFKGKKKIAKLVCLIFNYPNYGKVAIKYKNVYINLKVDTRDSIERNLFFNSYEYLDNFNDIIKPNGSFIDVGANIGIYSLFAAKSNSKYKVFAFEPVESNFIRFQNNIQLNNLDNIDLYKIALSDKVGSINFELSPVKEESGWGGISNSENAMTVSTARLDEIVDQDIEIMKIDVEGAELLVLLGARKLLEKNRIKTIIFEVNPSRMQKLNFNLSDIVQLLEKYGYKILEKDRLFQQYSNFKVTNGIAQI